MRVLSLDPKLVVTTSQFYLAGHWKWPHSNILSFTGSEFSAPHGLHFLSAPHLRWVDGASCNSRFVGTYKAQNEIPQVYFSFYNSEGIAYNALLVSATRGIT